MTSNRKLPPRILGIAADATSTDILSAHIVLFIYLHHVGQPIFGVFCFSRSHRIHNAHTAVEEFKYVLPFEYV